MTRLKTLFADGKKINLISHGIPIEGRSPPMLEQIAILKIAGNTVNSLKADTTLRQTVRRTWLAGPGPNRFVLVFL